MSLDIYLRYPINHRRIDDIEIFHDNITHNLTKMAEACDIYTQLWRQENTDIKYARDLKPHLKQAIRKLKADPYYYKTFDAVNGWGSYELFLDSLCKLFIACVKFPDCKVITWR